MRFTMKGREIKIIISSRFRLDMRAGENEKITKNYWETPEDTFVCFYLKDFLCPFKNAIYVFERQSYKKRSSMY